MANRESLESDIKNIINIALETEDTHTIPKLEDSYPTLNGNDGKEFIASILHIDLRGSTRMFENHYDNVIAKILMSYQKGITKIAKDAGGEIRSFNGDSMLVFFEGDTKDAINTSIKCAMQITYFIKNILNPLLENKGYSKIDFGIGIDHGKVLCVKVGSEGVGNRDLIWISEAVNRSVKLSDFGKGTTNIYISKKIYINLYDDKKNSNGVNMWSYSAQIIAERYVDVYSTSYWWSIT